MRKFLRSIICFAAVAVIMACFVPKTLAFAEGETIYSLVPSSFNDTPTQTKDLYNIDEVSNYKPFSTDENGEFVETADGLHRCPGMSFRLLDDDDNQIIDQVVRLKDAPALDTTSGKSLFLWINFDAYAVHGLNISLVFENDARVDWELTSTKLQATILNSSTGLQPHGWRLLEFPFSSVTNISGNAEGQKMKEMRVSYFSNPVSELSVYAKLTFYNVYVASQKGSGSSVNCLEKQAYLTTKFNDIDETYRNSFVVGDELALPAFGSAVKYAYFGEIDLKTGRDFSGTSPLGSSYTWQAYIRDPENEPTRVLPGEMIKFESEGTYTLVYHCKSAGDDIFTHSQTFSVRELNPIYFNISSLSAMVGEKYIISMYTSSLITAAGDYEIVNVPAGLSVTMLDDGKLEIVATKAGEYEFEVQLKGTRLVKPEQDTYKSTFSVVAKNKKNNDNRVLKIVLWSLLGVFGIILIVYIIILLVRARKFDVK